MVIKVVELSERVYYNSCEGVSRNTNSGKWKDIPMSQDKRAAAAGKAGRRFTAEEQAAMRVELASTGEARIVALVKKGMSGV